MFVFLIISAIFTILFWKETFGNISLAINENKIKYKLPTLIFFLIASLLSSYLTYYAWKMTYDYEFVEGKIIKECYESTEGYLIEYTYNGKKYIKCAENIRVPLEINNVYWTKIYPSNLMLIHLTTMEVEIVDDPYLHDK